MKGLASRQLFLPGLHKPSDPAVVGGKDCGVPGSAALGRTLDRHERASQLCRRQRHGKKISSRYQYDFFRAAPTTASTIHLSSRTLLEAPWPRKRYVWIANRLSNLSNIVDMEVCDMHSSQHWSSHYDLHSMFGWSETEPTLRGVQSSTGKRGLVLSRFNLSLPGFFSSAQVHFCRVGEMDRPLAWRQLVSLGQHALLHHR